MINPQYFNHTKPLAIYRHRTIRVNSSLPHHHYFLGEMLRVLTHPILLSYFVPVKLVMCWVHVDECQMKLKKWMNQILEFLEREREREREGGREGGRADIN